MPTTITNIIISEITAIFFTFAFFLGDNSISIFSGTLVIGYPHFGQILALSDILFLHSGHLKIAILTTSILMQTCTYILHVFLPNPCLFNYSYHLFLANICLTRLSEYPYFVASFLALSPSPCSIQILLAI